MSQIRCGHKIKQNVDLINYLTETRRVIFVLTRTGQTLASQLSSTFMQLLFSFDQDMRIEKTLIQTLACQLSSTLMQLLFSFDQDMRVEKTLIKTLSCQLSSTLMQLLFSFEQDMRVIKEGLTSEKPRCRYPISSWHVYSTVHPRLQTLTAWIC